MIADPKPIFLIGIPIEENISDSDFLAADNSLSKIIQSRQEKMPDYHVVGFLSNKIEIPTFTILSHDGKQSNV